MTYTAEQTEKEIARVSSKILSHVASCTNRDVYLAVASLLASAATLANASGMSFEDFLKVAQIALERALENDPTPTH